MGLVRAGDSPPGIATGAFGQAARQAELMRRGGAGPAVSRQPPGDARMAAFAARFRRGDGRDEGNGASPL